MCSEQLHVVCAVWFSPGRDASALVGSGLLVGLGRRVVLVLLGLVLESIDTSLSAVRDERQRMPPEKQVRKAEQPRGMNSPSAEGGVGVLGGLLVGLLGSTVGGTCEGECQRCCEMAESRGQSAGRRKTGNGDDIPWTLSET